MRLEQFLNQLNLEFYSQLRFFLTERQQSIYPSFSLQIHSYIFVNMHFLF